MAAKKTTTKRSTARKKASGPGRGRGRGEPTERIIASVVELAEKGGFEAVKIRDVASHAGVALGTLYRRFRTKEDLLLGTLELEYERLSERIRQRPPKGDTPLDRILDFFAISTRVMLKKPNLTRATIRAVASGDPELMTKVAAFHLSIARLIMQALRGRYDEELDDLTEEELQLCFLLQQVWFAQLVGWAGGLQGQASVMEQMRFSAQLILEGAGIAGERA